MLSNLRGVSRFFQVYELYETAEAVHQHHQIYAWFNFKCYHPPGQPRGQVQPFGPGGGELFEAVLSRREGGGANRK